MSAHASLIPELEEVVGHGSPERRAETLTRITTYFLDGASRFNEDHVQLFDDVFGCLIAETESKARAELSNRLAPVGNAPVAVVLRLAQDDDISIAGPVLTKSRRLSEADLAEIAGSKSQAHLLAIAGRAGLAEPVTDVLVSRGDGAVVRRVVENPSSRLSDVSFSKLVDCAEKDGALAEKVGLRPDIPPRLFRDLLLKTPSPCANGCSRPQVRKRKPKSGASWQDLNRDRRRNGTARLFDSATSGRSTASVGQTRRGRVDRIRPAEAARGNSAALTSLCAVPIAVVERLMNSERPDPVLILCKAAGWGWPTAKAILSARNGGQASSQALDNAYVNFERLSPATAQRVMRFWQVRRAEDR